MAFKDNHDQLKQDLLSMDTTLAILEMSPNDSKNMDRLLNVDMICRKMFATEYGGDDSKYNKKFVGTLGDFGCFSFYPTKILGAYGDGGFITTKSYKDFLKIKRLRFYGIETVNKKNLFYKKYYANENGLNSRLDEIQSTILNIKLKHVDKYINKRIKLANLYLKYLRNTDIKLPKTNKLKKHVFHLFTVSHPKRGEIIRMLEKEKIGTRIIYPYPINIMKGYKTFKFNDQNLKYSKKLSKEIFSLPLFPELRDYEVKKICMTLIKILKKIN